MKYYIPVNNTTLEVDRSTYLSFNTVIYVEQKGVSLKGYPRLHNAKCFTIELYGYYHNCYQEYLEAYDEYLNLKNELLYTSK